MERTDTSTRETAAAPSRNLLEPYLLLLLRNLRMHGYQLGRSLTLMGFAAVDPATVYRTLRQMEKEGLVSSDWETGNAGPAKRTYTLTENGEDFLRNWATALGSYQQLLDRFFQLYLKPGDGSNNP
ncbi:MAG: helix-turn-helix transcriptional regulator [Dehalococcoidia bacterium]